MDESDTPKGTRRERLARSLHRRIWSLEQALDRWRDRHLPPRVPRQLIGYRGYVAHGRCTLTGRVLADKKRGGPLADDGALDNLRATWRRFATREVREVRVQVAFAGEIAETVTDEEGYWRVTLDVPSLPAGPLWRDAVATLPDYDLTAQQMVMVIPPEARYAIVSDLDDTVLESSITHWRTALALTFLHNARTRKPLEGAAKLYAALQSGVAGVPVNPVFYVSSSPWNLYDLLDEFLTVNQVPHGPIFLRDLGIDEGKLFKSKGHGHKLERVRALMQELPAMDFILIGDSGQHDAELYAHAASEYGRRILAIYIRDVDPGMESAYDAYVDAQIAGACASGVPFLRVKDSVAIAAHAASLGLIRADALGPVASEAEKDANRPTLTEAAVLPTPAKPG